MHAFLLVERETKGPKGGTVLVVLVKFFVFTTWLHQEGATIREGILVAGKQKFAPCQYSIYV
jgi:hypothetical protein